VGSTNSALGNLTVFQNSSLTGLSPANSLRTCLLARSLLIIKVYNLHQIKTSLQCNLHSLQCSLHNLLFNLHNLLFNLHNLLFSLCNLQRSLHNCNRNLQ